MGKSAHPTPLHTIHAEGVEPCPCCGAPGTRDGYCTDCGWQSGGMFDRETWVGLAFEGVNGSDVGHRRMDLWAWLGDRTGTPPTAEVTAPGVDLDALEVRLRDLIQGQPSRPALVTPEFDKDELDKAFGFDLPSPWDEDQHCVSHCLLATEQVSYVGECLERLVEALEYPDHMTADEAIAMALDEWTRLVEIEQWKAVNRLHWLRYMALGPESWVDKEVLEKRLAEARAWLEEFEAVGEEETHEREWCLRLLSQPPPERGVMG